MYQMTSKAFKFALAAASLAAMVDGAGATDVVLIGRDLQVKHVSLLAMDAEQITVRGPGGRRDSLRPDDTLALAFEEATPRLPDGGVLVLADGQRLPGEAVKPGEAAGDSDGKQGDEDVLAWRHPWLGELLVELNDIASVRFTAGAPLPEAAEADVVLLGNGDRLEGFVVSLADPVVVEVARDGQAQLLEVPRHNVASVRLVSPPQPAEAMRAWLTDGTIVSMRRVEIEESGHVRLLTSWQEPGAAAVRMMVVELAGILLDASRLVPLAGLPPQRVEGPVTRYEIQPPKVLEKSSLLGLSPIEYRGPLVVRYVLPASASRFAAEAVMPEAARAWGDYELVISDEQGEKFRQRMNAENPVASINIELQGSSGGGELTIELAEGTHGSIQDCLVLNWAMLLVD